MKEGRTGRTRGWKVSRTREKNRGKGFLNYSFTNVREHVFTSLPFDPVLSTVLIFQKILQMWYVLPELGAWL